MLKVTDTWQHEFENLPVRSRLVSLNPRGHGTIWQEALNRLYTSMLISIIVLTAVDASLAGPTMRQPGL